MHQIINEADQCIVLTGTSITEKLNFLYILWNVVHYEIIQQRTYIISSHFRCCLIIRKQINISQDNVNSERIKTKLPTIMNIIGGFVGKW